MNAPIHKQVAAYAAQFPMGVTRADIAEKLKVGKGDAKYHLELCVKKGLLKKLYTFSNRGNQMGWVYFSPDNLPYAMQFLGIEIPEEQKP